MPFQNKDESTQFFGVYFILYVKNPIRKIEKTNTDKNRRQNKVSLKSNACGQAKNSNPQMNLERPISK